MLIITREADTLLSLAADYTLHPEYAEAIARYNGLTDGILITPLNVPLEPGLALEIPDSWLKPAALLPSVTVTATRPGSNKGLLIALGVIMALWLARSRRA